MVYCELSASNCARFGYRPSDAEDLLLEAGFVFARNHGQTWTIVRGRLFDTLDSSEQPATGYNLVALRPRMIKELASRLAAHGQTLIDHGPTP